MEAKAAPRIPKLAANAKSLIRTVDLWIHRHRVIVKYVVGRTHALQDNKNCLQEGLTSQLKTKGLACTKVINYLRPKDTMKSFVASTLLALLSAVTVSAQTAFAYPPSVTDTTTHENPFFLQVWSSQNTAYAYHAIGIQPRDNGDWRVVLGQDSVVTGFQLVNGSFQLASPEGQVGAADGFTAVFGPATTDALGFVSKDFYFAAPGSRNQTNTNWELLNLSNDGLYSILSNDGGPSTYNGQYAPGRGGGLADLTAFADPVKKASKYVRRPAGPATTSSTKAVSTVPFLLDVKVSL